MAYEKIGGWAFILGVAISVLLGFAVAPITQAQSVVAGYLTLVLVVLGLLVGLLNIGRKESTEFLIASIAVILLSSARPNLDVIYVIGPYLSNMVVNVAAFVAPAALVVGLKAIYLLASKPSMAIIGGKKK
ncbi:MAG: hypothetical protein V1813_01370 [Candidatus Aenigmatarchaeota archaeon]